jgi:PAS domain-containing protein
MPSKLPKPHAWDPEHLQLAIKAAGVTLWSWNVDTDRLTMDDRAFDLWGVTRSPIVTLGDLSAHIHPADRDRVRAAFSATRGVSGPYEIDEGEVISIFALWSSRMFGGYLHGARETTRA